MNSLLVDFRFFWLVLVSVSISLGGYARAGILTNGGFEYSLTGWSNNMTGGGEGNFSIMTSNAHWGRKALKVSVSNVGNISNAVQVLSASFPANATNTYVLRFWASTDVLRAKMSVIFKGATPGYPQIPFQISTNGPGGYQEYLYAFRASGNIQIGFNFQSVASYFIDDVQILDENNEIGWDVPMVYLWQWGQLNYSKTNPVGWGGGDNNKSVQLPDGSVLWIFNDSWTATLDFYSNIHGGGNMPRNCVVHQVGTNLTMLSTTTYFVPPISTNLYWIGDCLVEGNKVKVLLSEITGDIRRNGTAIGTISLPDLKLESIVSIQAPGADDYNQVVKGNDGYYYIYCSTNTSQNVFAPTNLTMVARTPVGFLSTSSAWRFWNGTSWVTDHTKAAPISTLSSPWSFTQLGTSNYVAICIPTLSTTIMAQFAPSPMGPWTEAKPVYPTDGEWGELNYMPNICAGTGEGGIYTIGYSDNGSPEDLGKIASDKSFYNPHFIRANLMNMSPFGVNQTPGGGFDARLSIKFAADKNWGYNAINNVWGRLGAGVLKTTNWFNFPGINGGSTGVTNVPFYTQSGMTKYASTAKIAYKWANEINAINDNSPMDVDVALMDGFINLNNNTWYLSVTNLDAVFTNGYDIYFYYKGNAVGWGGQNVIRYYAGATTNTTLVGTQQYNLYTTITTNDGHFTRDLTPYNTGTSGETPGANYFVFTNLSGGAFDLLISNGNYGGVNGIEIVASKLAAPMLAASTTIPYVGTMAILSCTNYAGDIYSYQWQCSFDGLSYTNVPGATGLVYPVINVSSSTPPYYRLLITAAGKSVASDPVQLITRPLPTLFFQQTDGRVILNWPDGTLLQATNVVGPWTTNAASSPYAVPAGSPVRFFRLQVQ